MKHRWGTGFTLVEILIVIVVVGIVAGIAVFSYSAIQRTAAERTMHSDLIQVAAVMQNLALENGEYPSDIPSGVTTAPKVTLTVADSGVSDYYSNLSAVQTGVLFAKICDDLIDEGVGKGVNSGGFTEDYITWCGNWNHDSTQVTGWDSEKFDTPVSAAALLTYANTFTTNNSYNKVAHEATVKKFYGQLVERTQAQGGSFPITSFWDDWATPSNGGVTMQPLPAPAQTLFYCIEARNEQFGDLIWHINQDQRIAEGTC